MQDWKLFINSTFLHNVPICKWLQQLHSPCHIHHFHHHLPAGSEEWLRTGRANLTHTPSPDLSDCPVRTQSISASQTLALDSLFPLLPLFLPWGPWKRAGAAATALRWLLISPSQIHSWKLSPAAHSAPSFPSFFSQYVIPPFRFVNFSTYLYAVVLPWWLPFVDVTYSSWLIKTAIHLYVLPEANWLVEMMI